MIDLHCHILPGVDDGPADIEESLSMAKQAVEDGIHTVVATPHALGSRFVNPPDKIVKDVIALQTRIRSEQIPLTLVPWCEVHICADFAKRILNNEATFLGENNRYVMVEFPFLSIPLGFASELIRLIEKGIIPVIAHPERNPQIHFKPAMLEELILNGCLIQLNATSITGGFGDDVMECAHNLLKNRLAHIIASDAHSASHRPPALSSAVDLAAKILGDKKEALQMADDNPRTIIEGRVWESANGLNRNIAPPTKKWFQNLLTARFSKNHRL